MGPQGREQIREIANKLNALFKQVEMKLYKNLKALIKQGNILLERSKNKRDLTQKASFSKPGDLPINC